MPQPKPLFLTPVYQPFILCGNNGTGSGGPRRSHLGWYRLWWIEQGRLQLRSPRSGLNLNLTGPCALLQPPGPHCQVAHRDLKHCRILEFDVVTQRRVHRARGTGWLHVGPSRQPLPMLVWGVDLPIVIPASHLSGLQAVMFYCGDQWWRGPFGLARANARLAEWLATYAEYHIAVNVKADDWLTCSRQVASQAMYQGITAAKWAELLGMSRQHFAKRYKAEAGVSPGEYLDQLRIDEARKLLMAGGLSIKEVAWLCGFRSLPSFSRFFRRLAGAPPRRWRELRLQRGTHLAPSPRAALD